VAARSAWNEAGLASNLSGRLLVTRLSTKVATSAACEMSSRAGPKPISAPISLSALKIKIAADGGLADEATP
jgi:hypothetical protein